MPFAGNIKFIEQLDRFNRKSDELRQSNFMKWMRKNKLTVSFNIIGDKKKKCETPSSESIKAFVLTFRFFIQKKDGITFDQIKNNYHKFSILNNLTSSIDFYTKAIHDELNQHPSLKVVGDPDLAKMTNEKLLRIFIYGYLSHENPSKHLLFKKIWTDKFTQPLYWFNFISTLDLINFYIYEIAKINQQTIKVLKTIK